jgi:D-amino-acid dehydrogenase
VSTQVVIVGAGAVGLCCAHYLARAGARVTVVERDRVGEGCTFGSAGWLCPLDANPLPAPGVSRYAIRSLFDAGSPLRLHPATVPGLAPWLLRFWLHCNRRSFHRGQRALARLGAATFGLIQEMTRDGIEFELIRGGLVCATSDPDLARATLHEMQPMREYGYAVPSEVMNGPELRAVEPALSPSMQAGFLVEDHWHLRPDSFSQGLAGSLRARGVEIRENTAVTGFETDARGIRAAQTNAGEVEGDVFVVASGVWSARLAAKLGVKVGVQPGKGYSFSVEPSVMPTHAIDLPEARVACSPFHDKLRIAGTMEFDGFQTRLNDERVAPIAAAARRAFLPWASPEIHDTWAGLRPVTADGLPIIDKCAPNGYIAAGHAMLGIHLSTPTGAALADFILSGVRPSVLEPFQVTRFNTLWPRRS